MNFIKTPKAKIDNYQFLLENLKKFSTIWQNIKIVKNENNKTNTFSNIYIALCIF